MGLTLVEISEDEIAKIRAKAHTKGTYLALCKNLTSEQLEVGVVVGAEGKSANTVAAGMRGAIKKLGHDWKVTTTTREDGSEVVLVYTEQ